MADVTIRNPDTGETRRVPESAAKFFPGYEAVDAVGRRKPPQPTPDATSSEEK